MIKFDFKNLPNLENENDAYCLDRDNNIGVLHFIGDCDGSHYKGQMSRCYELDGKLVYIVTNKGFKEIDFFGNRSLICKNDSDIFMMIDPRSYYIHYNFIFIPNKEILLGLFNDLKNLKEYYVVHDSLMVEKKKYGKIKTKRGYYFSTEEEALVYFNVLKQKVYDKLVSLRNEVKKIQKIAKSRVNYDLPSLNCVPILANKSKKDGKYHLSLLGGNGYDKRIVVVDHVDKHGVAHLTNGKVIMPNKPLMPHEAYVVLNQIENNDELIRTLNTINEFLSEINKHLKQIINVVNPFEKNVSTVYLDNMNKKFEKLCEYIESDKKYLGKNEKP